MIQLVQPSDLSENSFKIEQGKVQVKVDPDVNNPISLGSNGLTAAPLDTGWRRIRSNRLRRGYIAVRRVGNTVYLGLKGGEWDTVEVTNWDRRHILGYMPDGFRGEVATLTPATRDGGQSIGHFVYTGSNDANIIEIKGYNQQNTPRDLIRVGMISYPCTQPFPVNTNLPRV